MTNLFICRWEIFEKKKEGKSKVDTPNAKHVMWPSLYTLHFFFSQIRYSRGVQNFRPLFVGSVTAWMICPPGFIKTAKLMSLLHPFRNHWWSLATWLALSSAINSWIALFSALNCPFSPANEKETLKQNNQPDFKACLKLWSYGITGKWKAKNLKPLCGEANFATFVPKFCFTFPLDVQVIKW